MGVDTLSIPYYPHLMSTVIVTGISKGIGNAIVKYLLLTGNHVIGMGRQDFSDFNKIAQDNGVNYTFFNLDLEKRNSIVELFGKYLTTIEIPFGEKLFFIHNAGITSPVGLVLNLKVAEIISSVDTNFTSPMLLTHALSAFCQQRRIISRAIYISSGAAVRAIPGCAAYCASKAGLEMIVRMMHAEAQYLTVPAEWVALRPGSVETGMHVYLRSLTEAQLPWVQLYRDLLTNNKLHTTDFVARILCDKLIHGPVESGKIYDLSDMILEVK